MEGTGRKTEGPNRVSLRRSHTPAVRRSPNRRQSQRLPIACEHRLAQRRMFRFAQPRVTSYEFDCVSASDFEQVEIV